MNEKKEAAIKRGEPIVVLDIPLLFESHLTSLVEKIILVYVDEEVQLERLMKRNQFSKQEATARIQSQMPLIEKKNLSDFIIDNNGTITDSQEQLNHIIEKIGL